jgi:membrane protease YdiL (CAAX protease family)
MTGVLVIVGVVADAATRLWVARRRQATWIAMSVLFLSLSVASLLTGEVEAGDLPPAKAVVVGASVALVFFLATRVAMSALGRWPRFRDDSRILYAERDDYPVLIEVLLGVLVAAGEEIFWRGLVLPWLRQRLGSGVGIVVSLLGYVGTASAALSIPVAIGALVGGVVWTALAVWSGGILAGAVSHALWTALMIVFPPRDLIEGG